jgi:hypothetical protein
MLEHRASGKWRATLLKLAGNFGYDHSHDQPMIPSDIAELILETVKTVAEGDEVLAKQRALAEYERGWREAAATIVERLKRRARHFENAADYRVALEMQREAATLMTAGRSKLDPGGEEQR